MNVSVVYEDNDILVVNKPSGLITHPKDETDTQPSLTRWLVQYCPQIKNVGEDPLRPGLVHRLDKDTSGLLVVAKTQEAFSYLKNLFQTRIIKKHYLALVYGKPKIPSGIIDAPMGRIGMKRTTRIIGNKKLVDQKEAKTEYHTREVFPGYSLLEVLPHTGRTHQIRVHLHSIGTPIVGDPLYGPKKNVLPRNLDRLFLHAYKLSFTTPSGDALTLETDLPPELEKVLKALRAEDTPGVDKN